MARIKQVEPLVLDALTHNPATRSDDFLLILEVLKNFVTADMRLNEVLTHHVELGIPSFASIIRIRRKLQKGDPSLVNETMQEIREEERKEFKDYALNY